MIETEDAQGRLKNRHPVAVIDIGSNSVRLVIYEGLVRAPSVLFNEKVSSGLGRGIEANNRMDDAAVESALLALRRFRALVTQARVDELHVLATAAAREAENGPDFVARAEEILNCRIRILTGAEEAMFSAFGIMSAFRNPDGIAGDLGGGSLELVDVRNEDTGTGITLPLGVIRLEERSGKSMTAATKIAATDLKQAGLVKAGYGRDFYAVGGTWRNLAKLHIAYRRYPLNVTHHYSVTPDEITDFLKIVRKGDLDKLPGIEAVSGSRRNLLPYGAAVLAELAKEMKPARIIFSSHGVREGFLYSLLPEELRRRDALIEAADELAVLRSRSPRHARELAEWTGKALAAFKIDETADEQRYREAACRLADIGWRAHPDYRASQSLAVIAYGSFVQIDHQGRAYIALANYFRYEGLKLDSLAPEIRLITTDRIWERARYLGAFLRVAYLFTAAMPGVVGKLKWQEKDDGTMLLSIPKSLADLAGVRPVGRISQLAKVTSRNIELVVRD